MNAANKTEATKTTTSTMAYVADDTGRVVRLLGDVEDGSARETELARSAPGGCSLVALECDATVGDCVEVDESGVAYETKATEATTDSYGNPIKYGYTFEQWLRTAGRRDSVSDYDLRAAWDAGEDPSDYTR